MNVKATACGRAEGPLTWMATGRLRSLQTGFKGIYEQ